MEGLKEAINFIADLAVKANGGTVHEVDGLRYYMCGGRMIPLEYEPKLQEPIVATTLTSLFEYIKNGDEAYPNNGHLFIHVKNPTDVSLLTHPIYPAATRKNPFNVCAKLPTFEYGKDYRQEEFIIKLQSCFVATDDLKAVICMASNIVDTQEGTYSDDGVSQQAIIKTGVTTKNAAFVPNPVRLAPYRTFLEIPQPESDFVFRIGKNRDGEPTFKLTEADGGAWRAEAMKSIKRYIEANLDFIEDREKEITIIA